MSVATLALICAGAVAVPTLLTLLAYRSRTSRALRHVPSGGWGAPCIRELGSLRWTVLIVDDGGLRLVDAEGHVRATWPWATVTDVVAGPVRPYVNRSSRTGLRIDLVDGTTVGLLLPGPHLLGYPIEAVDAALEEIRRRRPG